MTGVPSTALYDEGAAFRAAARLFAMPGVRYLYGRRRAYVARGYIYWHGRFSLAPSPFSADGRGELRSTPIYR